MLNYIQQFKFKHLLIPLLAGLVYGVWAGFANSEHGFSVALRSGMGQGLYAFFSTWLVTSVARRSYYFFGCGKKGGFLGFAISFLVMLTLPLSVHAALATPNVWQAISPGLVWGSGYIAFYLWQFHRRVRLSPDIPQPLQT